MASDQEKFEREERAARLRRARIDAGLAGPRAVVARSGDAINENVYKAHEQGRNGFTVSDARAYADLFGVSLTWLYLGVGSPKDDLPGTRKAQGEAEVKALLGRIEGLPEAAIGTLWRVVRGYLEDAGQLGPGLPRDQFEPASRPRVEVPSR